MVASNSIGYQNNTQLIKDWNLQAPVESNGNQDSSAAKKGLNVEGNCSQDSILSRSGDINISAPVGIKDVRLNAVYSAYQGDLGAPVSVSTNYCLSSNHMNVKYDPLNKVVQTNYTCDNQPKDKDSKPVALFGGGISSTGGDSPSRGIFINKGLDKDNNTVLNFSHNEYEGYKSDSIELSKTDKTPDGNVRQSTTYSYAKNTGSVNTSVFGISIQKYAMKKNNPDVSYSLYLTANKDNPDRSRADFKVSGSF